MAQPADKKAEYTRFLALLGFIWLVAATLALLLPNLFSPAPKVQRIEDTPAATRGYYLVAQADVITIATSVPTVTPEPTTAPTITPEPTAVPTEIVSPTTVPSEEPTEAAVATVESPSQTGEATPTPQADLADAGKESPPDSEPETTSEPVEEVAEQPVSEKQPTTQLRTYVVQPGDNLFRISLRYNFPTQYVAQANGIVDWDRVHPGQVIVIPDPVPTSISRCEDTTYVVKRGDTLWRIANAFGVGTWQIAKANGLADPNKIKAGALLRIPNTTNCSP